MRRNSFETSAFEDFKSWLSENKDIYDKIISLLKDILSSPFSGIGKPEPLKHELKGYWSCRINRVTQAGIQNY